MTVPETATIAGPQVPGEAARRRPRWWREVCYVLVLYFVYSTVRNRFGSAGGPTGQSNAIAYGHALDIISIERALGLYFEQGLQEWYLGLPRSGLIAFWNVYYGTAHFIVTTGALVWLFRRDPGRYPRWRNTLGCTTVLALVGFASFSLMPPRLLDAPQAAFGPPASESTPSGDDGFVDTLARYETFWSFDSGALKDISNQYAAMPSLHVGWSLWSALVLWPMVRRRWARALVVAYPAATTFGIIVTANHFWLDGVGGAVTLAAGWFLGTRLDRFWATRHRDPATGSGTLAPATVAE